jgi:threonine synthase
MQYISTRGDTPAMPFQDAVLTGLAPDGGLLVPEVIPDVRDELDDWRGLGFVELAARVMGKFIGDMSAEDLRALLERSYARFDDPAIVPVRDVGSLKVLELFHGPTLAFKDVALQFLGTLFEQILAERGLRMNILGATSGDTGSAAIAGVQGKDGIEIFVMYPEGRTSALQELQMTAVPDANVHCLAIDGSFDDCQAIMKTLFNDLPFKAKHGLGAFNSVNWARVLAQVVYYVQAGLALERNGVGPTICVPTGNFGNIFAGYVALQMGVPIDRLILATNENDILARFFNTGVYRRGAVHYTLSPSMDIQVASNFERFLFLHVNRDSDALRAFMESFASSDEARLTGGAPLDDRIVATSVDTDTTLATIAETYRDTGYIIDPHTAVGVAAARQFESDGPVLCLATAHPAKFPESVDQAIGKPVARHPALEALKGATSRKTSLPADVEAVRDFVEQHAR